MVNVYKYSKGLNTMGIGQCGKFMFIFFFVYVMLNFVCTSVGTFLKVIALRPRALPRQKQRKCTTKKYSIIFLLFEY